MSIVGSHGAIQGARRVAAAPSPAVADPASCPAVAPAAKKPNRRAAAAASKASAALGCRGEGIGAFVAAKPPGHEFPACGRVQDEDAKERVNLGPVKLLGHFSD